MSNDAARLAQALDASEDALQIVFDLYRVYGYPDSLGAIYNDLGRATLGLRALDALKVLSARS